jgi:hypothetical protein
MTTLCFFDFCKSLSIIIDVTGIIIDVTGIILINDDFGGLTRNAGRFNISGGISGDAGSAISGVPTARPI